MSNAIAVLHEDIYKARETFISVRTDSNLNFEKEAGFAIQAITAGDYICKVAMGNRQSVVNAVNNIAAIGISLNPAKKQAYLVPRGGKICLDISYMGLLDLAIQSGAIQWGQAEVVYEADGFALNGFDSPPTHSRNPFSKERGAIVGTYCVVKTTSGDYLTTCMSLDEVYDIRNRSSAWEAWLAKKARCPWVTDEGEMIKKTVIKRAYKMWPKTEKSGLERAVHYLNTEGGEGLADIGEGPAASVGVIKATDGAMESQPIEVQEYLRELAENVKNTFNNPESGVSIAFDMVQAEKLESDQMVALWTLLPSNIRSALKKESKERKEPASTVAKA